MQMDSSKDAFLSHATDSNEVRQNYLHKLTICSGFCLFYLNRDDFSSRPQLTRR